LVDSSICRKRSFGCGAGGGGFSDGRCEESFWGITAILASIDNQARNVHFHLLGGGGGRVSDRQAGDLRLLGADFFLAALFRDAFFFRPIRAPFNRMDWNWASDLPRVNDKSNYADL
jgi:hypothetical protein